MRPSLFSLRGHLTTTQAGSAIGDVSVQTINSPITGFFNVSSNLKLVTSNAPIEVGVEAYHTGRHWPSTLRLITSNAYAQRLSLHDFRAEYISAISMRLWH